jgi:hypothetical protein
MEPSQKSLFMVKVIGKTRPLALWNCLMSF